MKKCLICTVTYNRLELTQKCFESLFSTADPALYSLFIIDNGSTDGTPDYLQTLTHPCIENIVYNSENLGTANALNIGWKLAYERGQHVGKMDNDITFYDSNALNKMLYVLETAEDVGLVGLKRRDLEEKPNHNSPFYRTWFYTMPNNQVIEISHHVIGTCWLVKHAALQKVGALKQIGPYGLDDSIYCHRMRLAGYYNVFIPDVAIEHIDPGHSKYPEYTQWKIDQARAILETGEYDKIMQEYKTGQRPVFEAFDD